MTTPLPPTDPFAMRLHKYLNSHKKLNSGVLKLTSADYVATSPEIIPRSPIATAKPLKCWTNVKAAANTGAGTPVFGWALWDEFFDDVCVAQPHAVLATPNGKLVCITPSGEDMAPLNSITFFADPRIPFDYDELLCPPLLALSKTGPNKEGLEFIWLNHYHKPVMVWNAWTDPEIPDNFWTLPMRK